MKPIAWISQESLDRLDLGGNMSRGSVPCHAERSGVACFPLFRGPLWRIVDANKKRWRTLDSIGMPDWTDDPEKALTFTLREHADLFSTDDPEDVRVEEVGS